MDTLERNTCVQISTLAIEKITLILSLFLLSYLWCIAKALPLIMRWVVIMTIPSTENYDLAQVSSGTVK